MFGATEIFLITFIDAPDCTGAFKSLDDVKESLQVTYCRMQGLLTIEPCNVEPDKFYACRDGNQIAMISKTYLYSGPCHL